MSRRFTLLRCALVCLGTIAPLAQTFADPVAITIVQGSIVVVEDPNELGLIDIRGTEGFHWEGSFENMGRGTCPCAAGQTLSFSTRAFVPWTGSTVRHRGETHTSFTFFDSYGELQLTGPEYVFPLAPGAARVTFQAPFTLEGEFGYHSPGSSMVWSLMGAGVATAVYDLVLLPSDAGEGPPGHFYTLRSLTYEFRHPNAPSDPVPEPATLSLVGAGAGAAAFNRWRRRRSAGEPYR